MCSCFNTKKRAPFRLVIGIISTCDAALVGQIYYSVSTLVAEAKKEKPITDSIAPIAEETKETAKASTDAKFVGFKQFVENLNEDQMKKISEEESKFRKSNPNSIPIEKFNYLPLDKRLEGMKNPFEKEWDNVKKEFISSSPFKNIPSYDLVAIIVKGNDDVRQEHMAIQFMKRLKMIYEQEGVKIYLRPYEIFITSANSAIIECIPNTASIDSIKKMFPSPYWNLYDFFKRYFYDNFEEAQKNFAESLAGYSLLTYFLDIKDRHNGNILLDKDGHIIHIDFGFFISNAPGGVSFESSPFKLTEEYIEILDGKESAIFTYFKTLLVQGMIAIKKHSDYLIDIISIMRNNKFPCFSDASQIEHVKKRLTSGYDYTKVHY